MLYTCVIVVYCCVTILEFVCLPNIHPHTGWSMQAANFLFISRDWSKDKQCLTDSLSYFRALNDYPLQLLIFPEGTDLSLSNKEKSQKYAGKNGLPLYEYVLHPRTKGFVHCINEMRKFSVAPTIINMSVGYVGAIPQNERDLAIGNWPSEIHFFSEQIPSADIPTGDQELEKWLTNIWQEKEEQLNNFYSKNRFNVPYMLPATIAESFSDMKFILGFWVVFFVWLGYSLTTSSFYWWYCGLWTVFYIVWNFVTDGMDSVAVRKYIKKTDQKDN